MSSEWMRRLHRSVGGGNGNGEDRPEEGTDPPPPFGVPPSEEGRAGELGPPPPVFRDVSRGRERDEGQPPPPYQVPPASGERGERRWWPRIMVAVVAALVLFVGANILVGLWVDRLWFDSLGYRGVFNTRIGTQVWLFFAGFGIAFGYLVMNMVAAWRLRPESSGEMTSPFPEFPLPSVLRAAQIIGALVAVFLAIILGAVASGQWEQILQFIHAEPFGVTDPEFDRDVGFFVFKLEPLQFMRGWATAVSILALVTTMGVYGFRFLLHQGDATT